MSTGHIHVIDRVSVCKRIVHTLLLLRTDHVGVACRIGVVHQQARLSLLAISTPGGDVYVFDLKAKPTMMIEGQIWRLLQSDTLVKVMHDCRDASTVIHHQYEVKLRKVYDTQAAYGALMMQNDFPPRAIPLHCLYEKFGETDVHLPHLQDPTTDDALYWSRRPLSAPMVRRIADNSLCLLAGIRENINRLFKKDSEEMVWSLGEAYVRGDLPGNQNRRAKPTHLTADNRQRQQTGSNIPNKRIVRLTSTQHKLIAGSRSFASMAPLSY